MSESVTMRRAQTHVVWQTPGSPSIRIGKRAMDGIFSDVLSVFISVPRRGAETGGILLGRNTGDEIVIDDFEPVACEHRFGPSYRLSEADWQIMEKVLARFRTRTDPVVSVLGYYRSNTESEFRLNDEDGQLIQKHFSAAENIILLIQPNRSRGCTADFFIRRDECFEQASQLLAFPFIGEPSAAPVQPVRAKIGEIEPKAATPIHDIPNVQEKIEAPREEPVAQLENALSLPEPEVQPERTAAWPQESEAPAAAVRQPEQESSVFSTVPSTLTHAPVMVERRPKHQAPPRRSALWITLGFVLATIGGTLGYLSFRSLDASHKKSAPNAKRRTVADSAAATPKTSPVKPAAESNAADRITEPTSAKKLSDDARIRILLNRWSSALKRGDLKTAAGCYAPRVGSYLGRRDVTRDEIRRSLREALGGSGKFDIFRISELKLTQVASDRAVATFRKRWQTSGSRKYAGEQQEQLTLVRNMGAWQIAAEEEQKIYWTAGPL